LLGAINTVPCVAETLSKNAVSRYSGAVEHSERQWSQFSDAATRVSYLAIDNDAQLGRFSDLKKDQPKAL
jgi:hypothetical protein